jgi:glutamyl-Q tRNA(Asp) synthetase
MTSGYRGRFAPSPTGPLHFGSLLAAFGSWLRARQHEGAWLVRIEDLDPPREVAGSATVQLRTLQAFGLAPDEPVVRQSERAPLYAEVLQRLVAADLAFECRCSRSDLAAAGGIHRHCVASDPARPAAWRARVPDAAVAFVDRVQGERVQQLGREVGDFVLRRVEGWYAYQLAVVVDDAAQGITEVVRGNDLLDSTPRQRWLQRALGYPEPDYLHLPLALDANGRKLGKSLAALPLDERDPQPALRAAWRFLGQDEARLPRSGSAAALLRDAVHAFEVERVPRGTQSVSPLVQPV